jgi:hypothetical protein
MGAAKITATAKITTLLNMAPHSCDTPDSILTRAGVARQSANGGDLLPR